MAINAATGSQECQKRLEYWISELQACADANAKNHPEWGRGYVGGVPGSDRIWSAFKKGDFGPYSGSWVPFYNLHKMYAGLRDAWLYCGNEQAKQLFLGFCDWAIDLTAGLSDAQMERALDTEHADAKIEKMEFTKEIQAVFDEMPEMKTMIDNKMAELVNTLGKSLKEEYGNSITFDIIEQTDAKLTLKEENDDEPKTFTRQ